MPTSSGGPKPGGSRSVRRRPPPLENRRGSGAVRADTPKPPPLENRRVGTVRADTSEAGGKGKEPATRGDLTARTQSEGKVVESGVTTEGKGKESGRKTDASKDSQTPGNVYEDFANNAGDKTGAPRIDGEKTATPGSQGDAPATLNEEQINKQVAAILDQDKVLQRFPHVREVVEGHVNALDPGDRVEVAKQIHEWTNDSKMRQAFKKLADAHAPGILEELGLVKGKPRPTADQRAQGVTRDLEKWLNKEVGKLNANATEIDRLREQIASAKTPEEAEAIRMAAEPRLWEEAARPPRPPDNRPEGLAEAQKGAANERFTQLVKDLSDKTLSQKQRRKLAGLLAFEFLLAGIQGAIPPER